MKKVLLLFALLSNLLSADVKYFAFYDNAVEYAQEHKKPVILFMSQKGCRACKFMKDKVLTDAKVSAYISQNYVIAKIDIRNNLAPDHLQTSMTPTFHFILADGKKFRESVVGGKNAKDFLNILIQAKEQDYFYVTTIQTAPNNEELYVKDKNPLLGTYTLEPKTLTLKDLITFHGTLSSDLTLGFLELSQAFKQLFDDDVVDRDDLQITTSNNPAFIDAAMMMGGVRLSNKTLNIDNSLGMGYIVTRISTKQKLHISLDDDSFLKSLNRKKSYIQKTKKSGKEISVRDIQRYFSLEKEAIKTLLYSDIDDIVDIQEITGK